MDMVLGAIGLALILLYLGLLRAARDSRRRWEAEHLRACPGCGRLVHPR